VENNGDQIGFDKKVMAFNDELRKRVIDQQKEINCLRQENERLVAESEGRLKVLHEKADELRTEWIRAVNAEGRVTVLEEKLRLAAERESALRDLVWRLLGDLKDRHFSDENTLRIIYELPIYKQLESELPTIHDLRGIWKEETPAPSSESGGGKV